ncbi:MAG TPA: OPT/YSL family transporter [Nannocystaceae bacterium]|nr:OPT/YSL family transporter [Nannocystaceae bacterium]
MVTVQLTARALIVGAVLGAVMGLSNLYVGLKLGLGVAVVVTASLLGWACIAGARRLGLVRGPMGTLELCTLASTASAAGYSTGVNLATAASAHAMVTGAHVPTFTLVAWTLVVAGLGLAIAVPLKAQLIDRENLPFPTGRAVAELVRGLGDAEAARERARLLVGALVVGALVQALTETLPQLASLWHSDVLSGIAVPRMWPPERIVAWLPALAPIVAAGFSFELSALLVGSGMLVSFRVAWSMALGAVLCWGIAVPRLADTGVLDGVGYEAGIGWSLWLGVPLLVASATTELLLRRGLLRRGTSSLRASVRDGGGTPVPFAVYTAAGAACGTACIAIARLAFDVPILLGLLAVIAAVALASVVARAAAETDLVPTGAVGKLVQLGYAGLHRGAAVPNLMATSITAGAAASCTDLLTDLRAGQLLGADPRRQCIAQAVGVVVGALVVVPVFVATIAPAELGTSAWPAPAARAWHTVAVAFADGISALPRTTAITMVWGAALGVAIAIAERVLAGHRDRLPSATGLALASVVPASHALSLFVGTLVALAIGRRDPTRAGALVTFAAGLVAGESLFGIAGQLLQAAS